MKKCGLLLAVVLTLTACTRQVPPEPRAPALVRVQTIESASAPGNQRYSASIEPSTRLKLTFAVGGYVADIHRTRDPDGKTRLVQPGDRVKQGTWLASLREADYSARVGQAEAQLARARAAESDARAAVIEARTGAAQSDDSVCEARALVQQAQGQLREAQAAELQARAQLSEARAAGEQARADFERARILFEAECLTRPDYEAARARRDMTAAKLEQATAELGVVAARIQQARGQVQASEARVRAAEDGVGGAQARVDRALSQGEASHADVDAARAQLDQVSLNLEDTSLKAPMDSVVLQRSVELGSLVAPGAPAFELGETSEVKAVFGVPDPVVDQLSEGQKVKVTSQILPGKELVGRISDISAEADAQSRVFRVEVKLANPDGRLKVGTIVTADLGGPETGQPSIRAPLTAIVRSQEHPGGYAAFVVVEEQGRLVARQRELELGETRGNEMKIEKGLSPGDRVVIGGASELTDGALVQIGE
ncbi:MAG: efflux RND transporter periplasmic adaptor subunit [Armatimonadetes bacterium]|nr:efflux RND transporter periplasmic adaptor subunit [Armatimonadota bacterium]